MGDVVKRGTKQSPRFYIRYVDSDGQRKQRAVKGATTKAEAQQVLAAAELRVAQGKVGIVEPTAEEKARATLTVRALSEDFLTKYAPPRIKAPDEYRKQARSVFKVRVWPTLGGRPAAQVTTYDVECLRDALLAGGGGEAPRKGHERGKAPQSVTRALAVLSKMYEWAIKARLLDCRNPVRGCERPRATHSLDFLSAAETGALLAHLEEHAPSLYPMVAAAIYAGLRKGELLGLRWVDVSTEAARLDVNRSYKKTPKSGKARHLPMHPELVRILNAWRDRCPPTAEGLVFPIADGRGGFTMGRREYTMGLPALLTAAGCHAPEKPWHSLRHTFASHFIMRGGNILTLQKLLGHANLDMTLVYAHLAPDFMAGEVARLSFARPAKAGVIDLGEARRVQEEMDIGRTEIATGMA